MGKLLQLMVVNYWYVLVDHSKQSSIIQDPSIIYTLLAVVFLAETYYSHNSISDNIIYVIAGQVQ